MTVHANAIVVTIKISMADLIGGEATRRLPRAANTLAPPLGRFVAGRPVSCILLCKRLLDFHFEARRKMRGTYSPGVKSNLCSGPGRTRLQLAVRFNSSSTQ